MGSGVQRLSDTLFFAAYPFLKRSCCAAVLSCLSQTLSCVSTQGFYDRHNFSGRVQATSQCTNHSPDVWTISVDGSIVVRITDSNMNCDGDKTGVQRMLYSFSTNLCCFNVFFARPWSCVQWLDRLLERIRMLSSGFEWNKQLFSRSW